MVAPDVPPSTFDASTSVEMLVARSYPGAGAAIEAASELICDVLTLPLAVVSPIAGDLWDVIHSRHVTIRSSPAPRSGLNPPSGTGNTAQNARCLR
ncbi:MAG: hypothetical protein AVDCRST_MAG73-4255 [uncultured Thermomicrobiales bacterium]|uniref:Uncharacterized protein n=1 Tax=uncultured Thermomicrobiales bacterium TaxID=1645740 RepID=A0A6J4V457_9BACT|nr:MAG: hypothetical protein AVDCRST_MAG73-4255 [uncultured Thermomicrobiales bacterium]